MYKIIFLLLITISSVSAEYCEDNYGYYYKRYLDKALKYQNSTLYRKYWNISNYYLNLYKKCKDEKLLKPNLKPVPQYRNNIQSGKYKYAF